MNSHFAALDALDFPAFAPGTVWLVGAGPGAPGLISLLGYHALGQADVIVYDALVSETLLKLANPAAEKVYAGKRGGKPSEKQADITLRLIEWAEAGRRVLRLKGGDPFMFGRGAEECFALAARNIPFRIVPGITAGIGGLAYAGIPATYRDTNHAVIFLTGHDETGRIPAAVDWAAIANAAPVIVMYMAVKHLGSIAEKLLAAGRSPADHLAVVMNATLPNQSVVHGTLGAVAEIEPLLAAPAIVVLGPVGNFRDTLDWFTGEDSPLANGLVIAAPRSGSGKTTVALGLLAAMRQRGIAVAPAKTGPDYIDREILAHAAGREAINLDPWAMSEARLRALASSHAADADLLLIEGVMGLFDGAASGTGSTGDLAATLGLPVILVVDADRQSQSIAALIHGFATWRPNVKIAGLILNRAASTRHEAMLRAAVLETGIPLLGILPRRDNLALPERHLGLVLPTEVSAFDEIVANAAEAISEYLDLNQLLSLSTPLAPADTLPLAGRAGVGGAPAPLAPLGQHTAIARDAAFAFLYPHWLTAWRAAGATLSFFSPLANEAPDPSADAILLPGGYPELHGATLTAASKFLAGLHAARDRGALIYGECGGFMVLGQTLTDKSGTVHRMSGLLPVDTRIDRPKRTLGYRRLTQTALPWPSRLNGHEFHYSSVKQTRGVPLFQATDALGEVLPPMGAVEGRVMGSYAHVIDVGD